MRSSIFAAGVTLAALPAVLADVVTVYKTSTSTVSACAPAATTPAPAKTTSASAASTMTLSMGGSSIVLTMPPPVPTASSNCLTFPASYQYPHLIIPVSLNEPDTAFGTVYSPTINDTNFVIYNFDIPSSYAGQTCDLVWALPDHSQLETSSYEESGVPPEFMALSLGYAATVNTTLNTVPGYVDMEGTFQVHGVSTVASMPCAAGQTVAYALLPADQGGNYSLTYFQDYNPCPIGLYVIPR